MMTRAERRKYNVNWVRARRMAWIKEHGPCQNCGSSDRLEIDHIDPLTKEFHPRELWTRRQETRDAELSKCQVLCYACHKLKSAAECKALKRWPEKSALRKFSEKDIHYILESYFIKKISRGKIAESLNVTRGALWGIVSGSEYKELYKAFMKTEMAGGRLARRFPVKEEDAGA